MSGSILWYVHDHGDGHLRRALAVIPHLTSPVVVAAGPGISGLESRCGAQAVDLPSDVDQQPGPTTGPWHYAPAGPALRARSLAIAAAVERFGCTTAVVDVSAEVTVLARLLGLRVVSLRQSGRRSDPTHSTAFASADAVWVPQHRALEPLNGEDVDERWQFSGAFSRFDGSAKCRRDRIRSELRTVVRMLCRGGHSLLLDEWARDTPPAGWRVVVIGTDLPQRGASDGDAMVLVRGIVDDVGPDLIDADVVITSAGWASVADVVACGARLVVVAEDRPFDEQRVRAEQLDRLGLAVHLDRWPSPRDLPGVLDRAMRLATDAWAPYHDGAGAARAAAIVERCHAS